MTFANISSDRLCLLLRLASLKRGLPLIFKLDRFGATNLRNKQKRLDEMFANEALCEITNFCPIYRLMAVHSNGYVGIICQKNDIEARINH